MQPVDKDLEKNLGFVEMDQDAKVLEDSLGFVEVPPQSSEVDDKSVFIEETNQVVNYSGNMDDDEIEYDVRKNFYNEVEDAFVGTVRVGTDLVENFAKGFAGFAVDQVPRAAIGLASEQTQEPFRFDISDFMGAILGNPIDQMEMMVAVSPKNRKRSEDIANQIQASYTRLDRSVKEWATGIGIKPDEGTANKVAFDVGSGVASLTTSLALAYFSKGKSLSGQAKAALFFGGLTKGQSFTDAQEKGKSFQDAQAISSAKGLAEGALEFAGLEIWTKYLRGSKSIQRTLYRGADEFVQEFSQELAGETIDKLTGLSNKDWKDVFAQAGYAGLLGLAIGLPIAGIQTGVENKGWVGNLRKAGLNDAEIDKVGELMQQKATQDSLPEIKKTLDQEARKFESNEVIPEEIRLEISDALQESNQVDDTLYDIEGRNSFKQLDNEEVIDMQENVEEGDLVDQDPEAATDAEINDSFLSEEASAATEKIIESLPIELKQELQRISETDEYRNLSEEYSSLQDAVENFNIKKSENQKFGNIKIRRFKDGYLSEELRDIPKKFFTSEQTAMTLDELADSWNVSLDEAINILKSSAVTKKEILENAANKKRISEIEGIINQASPAVKKAVDKITEGIPKNITVSQKSLFRRLFLGAERARKQGFREGRVEGENKSAKAILMRRRAKVQGIREMYGMTDQQLRSINKKDIRLMSDFEFKKFTQDIDARAAEMAKKRQAKNEVLSQIHEKQLDKDNTFNFMRAEMGTSSIDSMTVEQLNEFNQLLEKFQDGDVFLSTRILETIDNTDLSGVRTYREAKEKIAEKLGVNPTQLSGIMPDLSDYVSWDTVLAEKNAFYKYMVEQMAKSEMEALHEFLGQEKEIDALFQKARASRKKSVGDVIVPTDDLIFEYLDSPSKETFDPEAHNGKRTKEEIAKEMTKPEMDAASYVQSRFANMRDWLVQNEVLERYQNDYVSHIRRGFLETWKDEGPMAAVKDIFKAHEQDQLSFRAIDPDTGKILPMESFFKFAVQRTGKLEPSKNVGKAYKTYLKAFLKKQRFDKTVPAIELYAMMLERRNMSEEGNKIHLGLREFVHSYINNKKGRRFSYGGIMRQGGKVDTSIRLLDSFIALLDLGLNIPVSASVSVGEQAVTLTQLGAGNYAKGISRLSSDKGRKIVEDNREFVGKSPWKDLGDVADNLGDKFKSGLFIMFDSASTEANKIFLLGSLTDAEWEAGKVSSQRLAEMRTEMGRWRSVRDSKSILGSTSPATFITKYKSWALPIVRTTVSNLNFVRKKLRTEGFDKTIKTREFQELFRMGILSTVMVAAGKTLVDDDDDSMLGQILRKSYRESLSLIGALDLNMLTASRLGSFIADLTDALMKIATLEEYKTKEGYRGVAKLQRTLTPTAVKSYQRVIKDSNGSKLPNRKPGE